ADVGYGRLDCRERHRGRPRTGRVAGAPRGDLLEHHLRSGVGALRRDTCRRTGRGEVPVSSPFGLPLVLDGSQVTALVVGGGAVATRKIAALLDGGVSARVRALRVTDELSRLAAVDEHLLIEVKAYDDVAIGDAMLVVAATDDNDINARV